MKGTDRTGHNGFQPLVDTDIIKVIKTKTKPTPTKTNTEYWKKSEVKKKSNRFASLPTHSK